MPLRRGEVAEPPARVRRRSRAGRWPRSRSPTSRRRACGCDSTGAPDRLVIRVTVGGPWHDHCRRGIAERTSQGRRACARPRATAASAKPSRCTLARPARVVRALRCARSTRVTRNHSRSDPTAARVGCLPVGDRDDLERDAASVSQRMIPALPRTSSSGCGATITAAPAPEAARRPLQRTDAFARDRLVHHENDLLA